MLWPVHIGHHLYAVFKSRSVIISKIFEAQRVNQFGVHLWALDDEVEYTRIFLKILYIFIIFYYSAVTCIKFAM